MRQVVLLPAGTGGYIVEVPSLPGCRSQGKTLTDAITNVRQAIYAHVEQLKALGQPVPEPVVIDIPAAEGVIRHELLLREDVIQAVREVFPNEDLQTVLEVLDEYGQRPFETGQEPVQIAVVRLSEGNIDRLLQLVIDAKQDYRDVLLWYATKFGRYP